MVKIKKRKRERHQNSVTQGASSSFLEKCRKIETDSGSSGLCSFLAEEYRSVFGRACPDAMLYVIKAKIGYYLQHEEKKKAGIPMSKKFLKNYEAAQVMDFSAFDSEMETLMRLRVRKEEEKQKEGGTTIMAKVKRKVKKIRKKEKHVEEKKANKGKVGDPKKGSIRGLFWDAFAAGKSNEQALAIVLKARPDKKKICDIGYAGRSRSFYKKING